MCGIAGIFSPGHNDLQSSIEKMTSAISHRGPDSYGYWRHGKLPLAFGHRRLAIVDLSPTGHQPMTSQSGRFTMVFNGEIYNYLELREELSALGATFHGSSDTEVSPARLEGGGKGL